MPNYESKLRHLFPLLAQFHKGSLSRWPLKQFGDPTKDSSVLFHPVAIDGAGTSTVVHAHVVSIATVVIGPHLIVVALLGNRLDMGMLVSSMVRVLLLVMVLLLVHP